MKKIMILMVAIIATSISSFGYTFFKDSNNWDGKHYSWEGNMVLNATKVNVTLVANRPIETGGEDDYAMASISYEGNHLYVSAVTKGASNSINKYIYYNNKNSITNILLLSPGRNDYASIWMGW
jgi:hypothetical protein